VFFDDDYQPMIQPNSRGKVRVPGSKDLRALLDCKDNDFADFIDVSHSSFNGAEVPRVESTRQNDP